MTFEEMKSLLEELAKKYDLYAQENFEKGMHWKVKKWACRALGVWDALELLAKELS